MRRGVYRDTRFASCIGVEDGPFLPRRLGGSKAPLVVVKLEGPHMTAVRAGWIGVDGMDGTERALKLLESFAMSESRSEEHTSELQSRFDLVCRLLLDK